MRLAAFLMAAIAVCEGQSPITAPGIGKMLDAGGSLWPVYGVAGNLIVGTREATRVISTACSANLCLAKTANRILGPRTSVFAPAGPVLIGMNGTEAVLYFPASHLFARWRQGRLTRLPWHVDGDVLALRTAGFGSAEIAVRRDANVWVVRPDGAILDYLGEVEGPVFLLDDAVLLASGDELILRRADEGELRFELSGIQGFVALGPDYVQVNTAAGLYAMRTTPGREGLLLLPAPPEPPPVRSRRSKAPGVHSQ